MSDMNENNQQPEEKPSSGGLKAFFMRPVKTPEGKEPRLMYQEILSWVLTIVSAIAVSGSRFVPFPCRSVISAPRFSRFFVVEKCTVS